CRHGMVPVTRTTTRSGRLQWGRVVADTEWSAERRGTDRSDAGFNGAVSLPTRNGCTTALCFFDVARASMGPCRCRHGMDPRGIEVLGVIVLQWGRVVADTE